MTRDREKIQLRNYQLELLEEIKKRRSVILFLPTGSGKTFIASRLIKSKEHELTKLIEEGGKRSYFLVSTVQLVEQQCKVLCRDGFTVVPLSGDVGVDSFTHKIWSALEYHTEIFVMTAQIYINCLNHGYLKLENANLLILDECHHASKNHPMAQILKYISECELVKRPKLLGLTATLLNANIKQNNIDTYLGELETLFGGEIITSKCCLEIRNVYSSKPTVEVVTVKNFDLSIELQTFVEGECRKAVDFLNTIMLKENESIIEIDEIRLNVFGQNRRKVMTTALKDIETHLKEYGPYVAFVICRLYLVQLYRLIFTTNDESYKDAILYTITVTRVIKKRIYTDIMKIGPPEDILTVEKASSEKVGRLFKLLQTRTAEDKTLIFVERKMTAKALYNILKMYDSCGASIRPDFIMGTDTNPLRNTREGFYKNKQKHEVIRNFKKNYINVLVATNVLEEGIDIQSCNLVIMFDVFKTFRSYIQSKGRARMKGSKYVILNNAGFATYARMNEFDALDKELDHIIDLKNISADNLDDDDEDDDSDDVCYTTVTGAWVKGVSAVPLIHRYCNTLPRDLFTQLQPLWSYSRRKKRCTLQLPTNSLLRKTIIGPERGNVRDAKRAVAVVGVEELHKCGALDDNLLPIKISLAVPDRNLWFPNWEEASLNNSDGTKGEIFESTIGVPMFLKHCRPIGNQKMYLHIITTDPKYKVDTSIHRLTCCATIMEANHNFGIITRNPLPSICEFPVYSDLGEIYVNIKCNAEVLTLNDNQVEKISNFHRNFMMHIIRVKKCFIYDTDGDSNGHFIVPLIPRKPVDRLAWTIIEKPIDTTVLKPTEDHIRDLEFTDENYLFKVISPWYKKSKKAQYSIVVNLSSEKCLSSKFETDQFESYSHYYESVHQLTTTRPTQPLLEYRPIPENLDGIVPRPLTSSQKNRKKKKKVKPMYLPPEYCAVFDFPQVYWYKSIILPAILHRMNQLLLAEDLRQKIVLEADAGTMILTSEGENTVEFFKKKVPLHQVSKVKAAIKMKVKRLPTGQEDDSKEVEDQDIVDVERSLDINLHNIDKYAKYMESPLRPVSGSKLSENRHCIELVSNITRTEIYEISWEEPPNLHALKEYNKVQGPKPHQILKALTTKKAQDSFNLERFETLGDTYLKFMVSIFTYMKCHKLNEGQLTFLKGELVSNKNLFYCAKKLNIPSYINNIKFSGRDFWCPPSFRIPEFIRKKSDLINPISSLLTIDVPSHERFTGFISVGSVDLFFAKIKEYKNTTAKTDNHEIKLARFYLGKCEISHKCIADVMESLLGVYLQTSGIPATFKVLSYFGILSHCNYNDLFVKSTFLNPNISGADVNVSDYLPKYKEIEKMINYQFENHAYLIQAFTHPSDITNSLTDCYQKLEFVGDAVLDFLITSYIYEYAGLLNPGQLTDLRSSLVNNNIFGALAVRLGLYKYMRYESDLLRQAMDSFITYQEDKNHVIHGNELMRLLNEDDTIIAEEVEVPKALSDLFESLAGAIYLDSNCNLKVVWKIYYNIMKTEIAEFIIKIPINPVRALYEHAIKPKFTKVDNNLGGVVILAIKDKTYRGKGRTNEAAKRAAAKLALKDLNYTDFVI